MIGIIGAENEEIAAIKAYIKVEKENNVQDHIFFEGKIDGHDVVLVQSGIGKVNAAICTTLLLTTYDIDYVINVGSAGGLSTELNVGDVVISTHVVQHDFDVSMIANRAVGEIEGLPPLIPATPSLLEKAKKVLEQEQITAHTGLIVTGDQFVGKQAQVDLIKQNFPQAICSEMEAGAVGQTCYKFKTDFIIARSISDVFGKGDSSMQFDQFLKIASKQSAKMTVALITGE